MPLGKVSFDHLIEPVDDKRVRVVKSVEVQGAFGSLLRLVAPKMRRDIEQSLAALARLCPRSAPPAPPSEIGSPREAS